MNQLTSKSTGSRWLPAETVVVLPWETVNAKGIELKGRYAGNGPWQQQGCVARARNGDLVVMTTLADPPHTVLLCSQDQGRTWSKPQYVWENKAADEYAAGVGLMTILRSGRILALINSEYPGWPKDLRRPTWAIYSDDDGKTWKIGPPVTDTDPFLSIVTCFQMFEEPDGTIVMPVCGHVRADANSEVGGTCATGLLRSRDGGLTWGDSSIVMWGDLTLGLGPNEMAILPLPSGKWLALFRMNWIPPSNFPSVMLCRSISHDRGRTWSTPQLVLGATGYVCLQQLPDGGVMVSGSGAFGTRYLISYDEGLTWTHEQLLESCGDSNTTSVVLDARTVFLVHGSGMGPPHYVDSLHPHAGYCYAGLRGRWIRKQSQE